MMRRMTELLALLAVISYGLMGTGYAAQPGTISFSDDFDDGVADGWAIAHGDWYVANGLSYLERLTKVLKGDRRASGVYRQGDSRLGTKISNIAGARYGDFDATVEAEVLSSQTREREMGMVFRYQDPRNFYHLRWYSGYTEGDDHLEFWKYVNGQAILLEQIPVDYMGSGTKLVFKLSARGNQFTAQVLAKGKLVSSTKRLSVMDSTYASGFLGLTTYADEGVFDNVRVTG